jgi:signal transduction histidine kinase
MRDDVLGIVGMRERVGLVGGRLRVESTVGSGTTVAAEVPTP